MGWRIRCGIRRAYSRRAAHRVHKGDQAPNLVAEDRAALHCGDTVVRMVEEVGVFALDAEGAAEVTGNAAAYPTHDRRKLLVEHVAVDGMEVGVFAEEIDARWAGGREPAGEAWAAQIREIGEQAASSRRLRQSLTERSSINVISTNSVTNSQGDGRMGNRLSYLCRILDLES